MANSSSFSFILYSMLFLFFFHGNVASENFNEREKMVHALDYNNEYNSSVFQFSVVFNGLGNSLAILRVGPRNRPFFLMLDTGSETTWIQCAGEGAKRALHLPYSPQFTYLSISDPDCPRPYDACFIRDRHRLCTYGLSYADGSTSKGSMIRDTVHLHNFRTNKSVKPYLIFGCGVIHTPGEEQEPIDFDGILGLAISKTSITSQLKALGLITHNIHTHCFARHGCGFGSLGGLSITPQPDNPPTWIKLQPTNSHYVVGPGKLSLGGKQSHISFKSITIDSGTTFTYLERTLYEELYALVNKSLIKKPLSLAPEDSFLPVCWKGVGPFSSLDEVKVFFRPINLEFTPTNIISLNPRDYLIISPSRNICFGILNASDDVQNKNILGSVSMVDKLVIYDNERGCIGWQDPVECRTPCLLGPAASLTGMVLELLMYLAFFAIAGYFMFS